MFKLTDEQIEKAVEWWADQVCAPEFDGLSDGERRDPSNAAYQMAEIMASMSVKPIDKDQRQHFKDALAEGLQDPNFNPFCGLGVDYHPDRTLAAAAEKAGIPLTNFPWKTHMSFSEDGSVSASAGYGNPRQTI